MFKNDETIFISIGGSILYPDSGIYQKFLDQFNQIIRKQIADTKRRFFIMAGGGHIGREYQYAGRMVIGDISQKDLNWLGIHATRMNAHLLRTIFKDVAYAHVISDYENIPNIGTDRIVICAGGEPGRSTDYDMVHLAHKRKVNKGIFLVNVKQIYEKDPALFPQAKTFDHLTWKEYRSMIGDWWDPMRQLPFDPFASKLAQESDFTAAFVYGGNTNNIQNLLSDKPFEGTIISNTTP